MPIKILYDSSAGDEKPELIDGTLPVDLSVELAAANARVSLLEGVLLGIKARAQARIDADAATVDGKADHDAIASAGL